MTILSNGNSWWVDYIVIAAFVEYIDGFDATVEDFIGRLVGIDFYTVRKQSYAAL